MYVRFVTALANARTRSETGIFQSYFVLIENDCPEWILDQLNEHFVWFNANVDCPDRRAIHFGRRSSLWGTCWFRPEATELIRRCREMAMLYEEAGLTVRCLVWRGPAQVIWSDAHQIVAAPNETMPRGFH